jgi:hypothetical protein
MRGRRRISGGYLTSPHRRRLPSPMEVLFLTTLFSVLFAILFLVLFLRSRQDGRACSDQDALLPFRDEPPAAPLTKPLPTILNDNHDS